MKRHFLILLLIAFSNFIYSQKGNAILILKDSTQINGIGEISGISSIVTVKFSNDTLKYRTYNSKEIIGIDISENDYQRKFRYKYVDGKKFPEIVEIVSIDNLSLYIRIYEGQVLSNFPPVIHTTNLNFSNGQTVKMSTHSNVYFLKDFPRFSYYVGATESNQIKSLYTKGLPLAKSFKKSMKIFFNDCPELITKLENDGFSKNNVFEVVDFYNRNCYKSTSLSKEENKN